MKKSVILGGVLTATVLSGCATVSPQLVECLQPNRRVEVEVVGQRMAKPKPAPKPAADAKPKAEPDAATAEAKPKPKKPVMENVEHKAMVQGNWAFDYGQAALKDEGKKELDNLARTITKGAGKDTRPTIVGAIIIAGHIDRTEAADGKQAVAEARAVSVRDYLVSQGMDRNLMFWESKGDKHPVPVTKFCER
ncbi:MAG: hypothetical protein FJY56_11050 [Betaproteobacteria bacterium]|nr:hypothetical protein [Betaproteobacteria bacterium]